MTDPTPADLAREYVEVAHAARMVFGRPDVEAAFRAGFAAAVGRAAAVALAVPGLEPVAAYADQDDTRDEPKSAAQMRQEIVDAIRALEE